MPFKTRRQKLAAASRRFTFTDSGPAIYRGRSETTRVAEEVEKSGRENRPKEIEDLSYLRSDIIKIFLAASLIIGAQVALRLTLP